MTVFICPECGWHYDDLDDGDVDCANIVASGVCVECEEYAAKVEEYNKKLKK